MKLLFLLLSIYICVPVATNNNELISNSQQSLPPSISVPPTMTMTREEVTKALDALDNLTSKMDPNSPETKKLLDITGILTGAAITAGSSVGIPFSAGLTSVGIPAGILKIISSIFS